MGKLERRKSESGVGHPEEDKVYHSSLESGLDVRSIYAEGFGEEVVRTGISLFQFSSQSTQGLKVLLRCKELYFMTCSCSEL